MRSTHPYPVFPVDQSDNRIGCSGGETLPEASPRASGSTTFPTFWRFGDRLFFRPQPLTFSTVITYRQASLIRGYLWRTAHACRQPMRSRVLAMWAELDDACREYMAIKLGGA